ncbi:hypothetical protein BC827DRAFT_1238097 [Russula dissimulans]|nr:hypothetical protein BC827DRAFT_1238097 [Russula dissimulans]
MPLPFIAPIIFFTFSRSQVQVPEKDLSINGREGAPHRRVLSMPCGVQVGVVCIAPSSDSISIFFPRIIAGLRGTMDGRWHLHLYTNPALRHVHCHQIFQSESNHAVLQRHPSCCAVFSCQSGLPSKTRVRVSPR